MCKIWGRYAGHMLKSPGQMAPDLAQYTCVLEGKGTAQDLLFQQLAIFLSPALGRRVSYF